MTHLEVGVPLYLYLFVNEHTLRFVLVQEKNKNEWHVYFVSKVFKVVETKYQKTERLVWAVVITTRKLIP